MTSYFHLVDLVGYNWGEGPSGRTNCKGLLRGVDYSPKPAYFAFQRLCSFFVGETRREGSLDRLAQWSGIDGKIASGRPRGTGGSRSAELQARLPENAAQDFFIGHLKGEEDPSRSAPLIGPAAF